MSYFNKKRVMFWVVIAVIIINFTAIGTIIYKMYHMPKHELCNAERPCAQTYLEKELQLTPIQADEFKKLKKAHHDSVLVLNKIMSEKRKIISENMVKPDPDTTLLFKTTDEIGAIFAQTRKLYISHYFDLRNVCNTHQQEKLAKIYTKVFCSDDRCSESPDNKCNKGEKGHKGCDRERF
jgi:hypothetical protein